MKVIFIGIAIFFFSWITFASEYQPSLGDNLLYQEEMRFNENGPWVSFGGPTTVEIVQETNGRMLVRASWGNSTIIFSEWMKPSEIVSEIIANIDDFCRDHGGSLEPITVKAGSFQSCKLVEKDNGEDVAKWYVAGLPLQNYVKWEKLFERSELQSINLKRGSL